MPLLLSAGYHVNTDLAEAVSGSARDVTIAPALGSDDRLVDLLRLRLWEAGTDTRRDVVLLGAAGSSAPGAVAVCRETAGRLQAAIGAPVTAGFLSFASPGIEETILAARTRYSGRRIVVASYLLAPGYFQNLLSASGADVTTEPLLAPGRAAPPEQIVDIVTDRYRQPLRAAQTVGGQAR